MVVADDTGHGQVRKRPRLSLKAKAKNIPCSPAPVENTQSFQGSTPQDVCDSSDDAAVVQFLDAKTTEELADQFESTVPNELPAVPPVASLENIGNTCFLNSVLQILRYTPGFLDGLGKLHRGIVAMATQRASIPEDGDEKSTPLSMELVRQLFKLYKSMEKREERYCVIVSADVTCMAVKPDRVLDIIREFNPMFEGNLQHDAQELLRCLLCYLEDAERDLHQAQMDLDAAIPISRLPHSPINPIMQRFLVARKRGRPSATVSQAPVDEAGDAPTKESVRADLFKEKFVNEADGMVTNSVTKLTGFEAKVSRFSGDGGSVDFSRKRRCSGAESLPEKHDLAPKENGFCNGTSNGEDVVSNIVQYDVDSVKSDKKRLRNMKTLDENVLQDQEHFRRKKSEICSLRKMKNVSINTSTLSKEHDVCKKMRSEVHPVDKSQPSILSMFTKSTCRLGMRGRVVKKEVQCAKNKLKMDEGCATAVRDEETRANIDVNDDEVTFPKLESTSSQSPSKLNQDFSKMSCKSPVRNEKLEKKKTSSPLKAAKKGVCAASPAKDNNQPTLMVKLENCDHVCNSPLKSVKATLAMSILSPAKRRVNFDTLDTADNDPDDSDDGYGKNSGGHFKSVPVRPLTVPVEKCDKVCNSPLKSVSARLAMKYLSGNKLPKINFVEKLFQGTMMLRTRCLECEFFRERKEDFQDVSVPLKREQESSDEDESGDDDDSCLSKLMSAFTEVERLRDDNKYFCDLCRCYVEAERSLHYDRLPDVLTLHLKRFSASGSYGCVSKINDHVTIPQALPCLRYKCPKPCSRPDHRYNLYGIVTHAGVTISSGHYLSYVRVDSGPENTSSSLRLANFVLSDWSSSPKKGDNSDTSMRNEERSTVQWFECNDESIRIHSDQSFRNCLKSQNSSILGTPYVLFYQRVNLM